jgi:DNA end-binding protein Ku
MAATVWRGQLTFGLVSFPVRLYTAARKERVRLHYLRKTPTKPEEVPEPEDEPSYTRSGRYKDAPLHLEEPAQGRGVGDSFRPDHPDAAALPVARVKQELMSVSDERPVPREELLKGYEVGPERYVTFTNEELRRLRPATSPDMQILRSVRLADIDPVYFETSYFVAPDHGGERAYALLFAALQRTQYVAIAKVTMHGREHILVVRPGHKGLLAHTMYYNDEIRAQNEFETSASEVAPKELELATTFVEAISGPFAPEEFKDSYREQVQNMISSKMERSELAASAPAPQPVSAPVVNILEALKKSLELARKPAKGEVQVSGRPPGKVTELKSKSQKRKA